MVVKDAMSEKNTVTSASLTSKFASASLRIRSCTTGQGTYLPQETMPFFRLLKDRRMTRSSHTGCADVSSVAETAESCRREMLSISSASSTRGLNKLRENHVRSLVSNQIPVTMTTITTTLVHMAVLAAAWTARRLSSTATAVVFLSSSSAEISLAEKSGTRSSPMSTYRWGDLLTSRSTSRSEVRKPPHAISKLPSSTLEQLGPATPKSLQTVLLSRSRYSKGRASAQIQSCSLITKGTGAPCVWLAKWLLVSRSIERRPHCAEVSGAVSIMKLRRKSKKSTHRATFTAMNSEFREVTICILLP
mmetsp:Transcript_148475/g.413694  ORF Transcript_148475/g.413694 Transcript_148475/m.413694 type:complete len:305 (-) Transcript_148475:129-1043(-)